MRVTMKTTSSRAKEPIWRAEERAVRVSAGNRAMHRVKCTMDSPSDSSSGKALVEQRECHSLNRLGNKYKEGYLQMCMRIAKVSVCRASSIKSKSIGSVREGHTNRPQKGKCPRERGTQPGMARLLSCRLAVLQPTSASSCICVVTGGMATSRRQRAPKRMKDREATAMTLGRAIRLEAPMAPDVLPMASPTVR